MKLMANIATYIKSRIRNGIKNYLVDIFRDDAQWHVPYTLPNIESVPVEGDKCVCVPLDKEGRFAVLGIPLKTDLSDGETRITGRDSVGNVRGFVYVDASGDIKIGLNNFRAVMTEDAKVAHDTHTHSVVVGSTTLTTSPPNVPMSQSVLSTKTKVE